MQYTAGLARPAFGPLSGQVSLDDTPPRNRLLASLDPTELEALKPHLETWRLEQDDVLFEANETITHVYFPESVGVSLIEDYNGRRTMAGTVGNEGMVGIGVFLGQDESALHASTHLAGTAHRMTAATFRRMATAAGPLHQLMLGYANAFLTQIIETHRCNGAHRVEQRCARWLLLTCQRADAVEFPLALESLALVIGVKPGGVLLGLRSLQRRGLIEFRHSHVRVFDRRALEENACECARTVGVI